MRYRLLDTLRGISVVSMILFHACWDLVNLYHFDWPWFQGTAGHVWQQSICWAFILISGFCMGLKKEDSSGFASCKRGLILLAAGILVTVSNINEETLGFEGIVLFRLPEAWYEQGMLATFLGFQDKNFFSTDYFSLLPWYFLFLAGYFLCRLMLERTQTLPDGFANGIPLFEIPGRHSLLIYLLHQPVILLLLSVVLKPVIRAM